MLSKLLILRSRVRKVITSTICKYLDCGIMENGFARVRCPGCGYDFFVAFSCKTRFFCPSCAQKRTLVGLDGKKRIAAEVSLPLVAIGGVTLGNMAAVKAAGAKYLAMVREFQTDTAARVAAVNRIYEL